MIFDAPAKLNLALRVLAREAGGFHQIESLFCALELCDEIEAERQPAGIDITVVGDDTPASSYLPRDPRDNLVHRAATAFFGATKLDGGAALTLTKRIPVGAGLGGGSSDAAATLVALNELYARPLAPPELLHIGARIGSDIPFFMCGSPFALAWSRGTRLLPLPALPQRPVVLVAPGEGVSTAQAYSALAATRTNDYTAPPAIVDAAELRAWHDVALNAVNDFEAVIFDRIPELGRIKADLATHGARPALLTGTGSVVFGVFEGDDAAEAAAAGIRRDFRNVRVIVTRTAAPYSGSVRPLT